MNSRNSAKKQMTHLEREWEIIETVSHKLLQKALARIQVKRNNGYVPEIRNERMLQETRK